MKKLDQLLAFLAYSRRISLQLLNLNTLKHFHLIFRGFTPNKGVFYDFKQYGYKSYVNCFDRYLKTIYINYHFRSLFRDKYISYIFLRQYTDKVVPVYALVDNGKCYFLDANHNLQTLTKTETKFVIKPKLGYAGKGVLVLEVKDGKCYLNGVETKEDSLYDGVDNHVMVPYVFQHQYSSSIYPKTLNTFRLLTCILDDKIHIIAGGHRFGSNTTGFVDNFAQGGISCKINIETGTLEDPTSLDRKTFKKKKVEFHPDTQQKISGTKIPFWETIVDEIKQLHLKINFVKYVGWDIAVTSDSYRIIEANDVSDVDGLQMHSPFLINERNRKFYAEHT